MDEKKKQAKETDYVTRIFNEMDKDKDGFLVKEEMIDFVVEGFGWVVSADPRKTTLTVPHHISDENMTVTSTDFFNFGF